jgi:hypothetical protein
MALHNDIGGFESLYQNAGGGNWNHGLGNSTMMESLTAFEPIVDGFITSPL